MLQNLNKMSLSPSCPHLDTIIPIIHSLNCNYTAFFSLLVFNCLAVCYLVHVTVLGTPLSIFNSLNVCNDNHLYSLLGYTIL